MREINLNHCEIKFSESFSLVDINWQIKKGEHWVLLGPNGSGKSALSAVLKGDGEILSGDISVLPESVEVVSFDKLSKLIESERLLVKSGGEPALVSSMISERLSSTPRYEELLSLFQLERLLPHSFSSLSTGESRKVLLLQAILTQPDILILDEPFDGLDRQATALLQELLKSLSSHTTFIFVLNRYSEIPAYINNALILEEGRIQQSINNLQVNPIFKQILHLDSDQLIFPDPLKEALEPKLEVDAPLLVLKDACVKYSGEIIFEKLNWQINSGEHWQLIGANGSGKTSLLNLITGDNPQCYNNDIKVFGFQRGQGESIWQIKQYIGYVSSAFQWEYRVGINLQNLLLSGFFDSIGLYAKATDEQKSIVNQWLALLDMSDQRDQSYQQLSYGEQRLLLIARAMVKQPALLILDEPCLGLDQLNRQLVLALIKKICEHKNTTVIYVNHHTEDSVDLIERRLVLD